MFNLFNRKLKPLIDPEPDKEEAIEEIIDHAITHRLTPNELIGGFDRPGWKMMAFMVVYTAIIASIFVILPLYMIVASLLAVTSFAAVLEVIGISVLIGLMVGVMAAGCFLWVYEGYAFWRTKRYLADRKMRLHQLDDTHYATMDRLLEKCVRDHIKHHERDPKFRMKRHNS